MRKLVKIQSTERHPLIERVGFFEDVGAPIRPTGIDFASEYILKYEVFSSFVSNKAMLGNCVDIAQKSISNIIHADLYADLMQLRHSLMGDNKEFSLELICEILNKIENPDFKIENRGELATPDEIRAIKEGRI